MKFFFFLPFIFFNFSLQASELQLERGGLVSFREVMNSSCELFHAPLAVRRVLERHSQSEFLSRMDDITRRSIRGYGESYLGNKEKTLLGLGFAGSKLYALPDEKSKVVGYFLYRGLHEMFEIKLGQSKSCWHEVSDKPNLNDKHLASEFIDANGEHVAWLNEYVNYPARFWELKEGQPEQYDMKWYHKNLCETSKDWSLCKEATNYEYTPISPSYFYVRDSKNAGPNKIEKKYFDVWRQLPFKVGGVYPWIIQRRDILYNLKTKPGVGEFFNDMLGKQVYFTVMPEYLESADGSIIYLRKYARELEFKNKKVVKLINGYDYNFDSIKITRTTSEHMYFTFGSRKDKKMLEARVGIKELFRKNGSIRLKDKVFTTLDYSDYILPIKKSENPK